MMAIDLTEDISLRLAFPDAAAILQYADRKYAGYSPGNFGDEADYIIYEFDCIKWYESWDAVQNFEDWMNKTEDAAEDGSPFQFMRSGEEISDVEHRGTWRFNLDYGLIMNGHTRLIVDPVPNDLNLQLSLPMVL